MTVTSVHRAYYQLVHTIPEPDQEFPVGTLSKTVDCFDDSVQELANRLRVLSIESRVEFLDPSPAKKNRPLGFNRISYLNPGIPFVLSGISLTGVGHAVVISPDGQMYDPSIDSSGIVKECEDGFYWVWFYAKWCR